MRNWLACLLTAAALLGCASSNSVSRQVERYRVLAAEPTPAEWQAGAVWTFIITDHSGSQSTLTFRISDAAADTCISGNWRALELLDGEPGSLAGTPSIPAALVEGRNLWISLTSNWCDLNNDLKGELQGDTFSGQRTSGGMTGSTVIGQVQGWRVK